MAATLLMALLGRIAGISGIVGGLVAPVRGEVLWRALFVAGLLVGGAIAGVVLPSSMTLPGAPSIGIAAAAGLLVGIGTRLGNGCTSGHGVCGIARLSRRSVAAAATFIAAGMLAATLARTLGLPG